MKIVVLLLKILKYTIIPFSIVALVFFRAVIFQADINQYLDAGLSIAEDNLDIKIPAYARQAQKVKITAPVQCEPVIKDDVVASSTEQVTPALVTEVPAEVEVEATTEINDSADSSEIDIIEEISAAANAINEKVEMLFEEGKKAAATIESEQLADKEVDLVATEKPDIDNEVTDQPDQAALQINATPVDTRQQLMKARELFWNGRVNESEQAYLNLIAVDDTNPDVYGELGNVYYAQGSWKQAGEAYYQAAVRLMELKKTNQVNYLLRVIQGLDAKSAEKLKDKISG